MIFTGIMNSTRYCSILENGLVPFLKEIFPDGHRFQQDNDPKHCSNFTKEFLEKEDVNRGRVSHEPTPLCSALLWRVLGVVERKRVLGNADRVF